VLIDRVARLLLRGEAPSSFLCITYTKAAAAEMRRRLFERLGAWCVAPNDQLSADLRRLDGSARPIEPEELDRARSLFARALEPPGGLKIQTIHSLCERLLRRFPLEARVTPGFTVLEEAETESLMAHAWSEAIGDRAGAEALARLARQLDEGRLEDLV